MTKPIRMTIAKSNIKTDLPVLAGAPLTPALKQCSLAAPPQRDVAKGRPSPSHYFLRGGEGVACVCIHVSVPPFTLSYKTGLVMLEP